MSMDFVVADCLDWMRSQPNDRFDLVFGSPPYCDARTYGIDAQRDCRQWVEWMLAVTTEAARVCRGPVIWVAAGVTRDRGYWPACEGLMWEWWKLGGARQLYRPCVFHRVGIPGSGGNDWFRADWEYVMCFKRPGALPWSDNTACGHPPKWAPGGEMSHRLTSGQRRTQWGHSGDSSGGGARAKSGKRDRRFWPSHRQHTKRRPDGEIEVQGYNVPAIANPGNVVEQFYTAEEVAQLLQAESNWASMPVGGGLMGHPLAHENEAPFPERLAERYVRSCCPEDGWVLDPFSGSGTTAAVCQKWGRNCVGVDIRQSQVDIGKKRTAQRSLLE